VYIIVWNLYFIFNNGLRFIHGRVSIMLVPHNFSYLHILFFKSIEIKRYGNL